MVKRLGLLGFDQGIEQAYQEQIWHFFRESLQVKLIKTPEGEALSDFGAIKGCDLLAVPSHLSLKNLEALRSSKQPFIVADRTVSRHGLDQIQALGALERVGVVDRTRASAMEMIAKFCQLGLEIKRFIPLEPNDLKNINPLRDPKDLLAPAGVKGLDIILQFCDLQTGVDGQNADGQNANGPVMDLQKHCLLDINSLSDISARLGLDHKIRRQSLQDGYQEIVTFNQGLSWISGQANQYERQLDMLLQVVEDGIVAVTTDGIISSHNRQACQILNCQFDELTGKSGVEVFPQIPFDQVLETRASINEVLVTIDGCDIVLSVEPIHHSGKFYGAVATLKRYSDLESRQHKLRSQLIGKGHKAKYHFGDLIGKSDALVRCKEIAKRMAASESPVLISGESGTGKELFAQAIHHASRRKNFQFVAMNCGAITESLLESELFGYEEGAFTGAKKGGKPGLLELAHKGTLFLDEVGEMPLNLQTRLLRVLQEKEVMRVGGDRVIPVDLRIIAATNKNLKERVLQGHFREDLYYRINVLPLMVPHLSSRREDIPVLIAHFQHGLKTYYTFTPEAQAVMMQAPWRGNIRELRNCVEYLAHLGVSCIDVQDLPRDVLDNVDFNAFSSLVKGDSSPKIGDSNPISLTHALNKTFERELPDEMWLLDLMCQTDGTKRLGRRSMSAMSLEKGRYLSEQEIRRHLLALQKEGLVTICIGRGGTRLTPKGRQTGKSHQVDKKEVEKT